ncbi:MAG TPA: WD40 repeat domain-containing serine/threonine-protein kinase [Rudaea sp.]|nr:WD40 repeat domain-containing serine/threonine-protein kinase [Rudaea sp.]
MNHTLLTPLPSPEKVDSLAQRGLDVSMIAQLAFARAGDASVAEGRHLALLPIESLELDLSDPAQCQFGDYELVELIGEGGMGVVYRARQLSLDREVAIKLLAAGVWASAEFVERFRREAQNAARMQHPNIVPVYEVGDHDGLHFFSMRLIGGPSLAAELKREKKLSPQRAAQLLRTIAEAVDYAHRLGVLHLDLKPANVLIDENGIPHVADFGLARRIDSALAADSDEVSGTPSYMAPEQASPRASRITRATDIWGLGAILYELVTGEPPFLAHSPQETLKLVVEGSLRNPRRYIPDLPRDLEAIILKCMAYRVEERYASARDLSDDLARFLEGRAVRALPLNAAQRALRWTKREPKLAAAVLAAFAALLIGLAATTQQWRRADANAGSARENLWATRAQTAHAALAGGDGFRGLHALITNLAEMEADGRTEAAAIERQRIGTILANAPQLLDVIRAGPGERATSVAIAPDGRHVAVATELEHGSHRIHQYELGELRETWSVNTDNRTFLMAAGDAGAPHSNLHYTADGRFLLTSLIEQPVVPAPRYTDMIAFDARDGRVLWPEGLAEQHADIVYDDTLRHALVRFRSDRSLRWPDAAQFYEIDGWRAIGPRHTSATTLSADNWLPAPDGSAWLGTRDSAHFALYTIPALEPIWQLQLPESGLVRAWRFSHDGHRIALGGVDGTVLLVEVSSGRAAELSSGPTTRVMRVDFDAGDRTLAAVDESGQLWAWDVATRLPRVAPLNLLRGGSEATLIRFAGDTLYGGGAFDGGGDLAYATLAPRAPFNNEAVRGAARLRGGEWGIAFDVATDTHRLVTAGFGNLIEVWQLPPSPLLTARAAPLPAPNLTFDGRRIVAVDGNDVRVMDAVTGAAVSPPLRHPEPVRFAELSPDGRALATIAGRTVRIIDPGNWQLRGTPILLPQTPLRLAFAETAPLLVVTTADYEGDALHEQIYRIDLTQGALRGAAAQVNSLNDLEIDPQGRYAIVSTWDSVKHAGAGPLRMALDSGVTSCAPDLGKQWYPALAADSHSAWFSVALPDSPRMLQHWDFDACREIALAERIQLPESAVLMPRGDEVIVHRGGNEALIRIGADGRRRASLGEAIPGAMYKFALSADGARAAVATRNAVHLLDAHQGRRLSAPLTAPIGGDDAIADLAFSPDGARLLARTINGRWLLWAFPRAEGDVGALARLARVLDPNPAESFPDADLDALRAQLHGAAQSGSGIVRVANEPILFALAVGAEIDPRFVPLDLAPAINVPLVGKVWSEPNETGDKPTLAAGLQRFLGVDYRIDGGVQLSGGGTALALGPELHRSAVVDVPGVTARRVHVLASMQTPMPRGTPSRPFAHVVLIGADGRETRLEIRTVRDIVSGNPNHADRSAHIAWMGADSGGVRSGGPAEPGSPIYAVALDVPSNVGPLRGLRLDVADGPIEAPLFYAATLERADAGAETTR